MKILVFKRSYKDYKSILKVTHLWLVEFSWDNQAGNTLKQGV